MDTDTTDRLPEPLKKQARQAFSHYINGRFRQAIDLQKTVVAELVDCQDNEIKSDQTRRLGGYHYAAKDLPKALAVFQQALAADASNLQLYEDIAVTLILLQQYETAIGLLHKARVLGHHTVNLLDALSHSHGSLGNYKAGMANGTQSLLFKLIEQSQKSNAPKVCRPKFKADQPRKNLIAFSHWGNNDAYLVGLKANIIRARTLFRNWRVRAYCARTVPAKDINALTALGAEVKLMDFPANKASHLGHFWRFEVASDPEIDFFIVRDSDSLLGVREKLLVEHWVNNSSALFFLLRDGCTHGTTILAGLWGGVGQVLLDIQSSMTAYHSKRQDLYGSDQWFLNEIIWPQIRHSVLVYDTWFKDPYNASLPAYSKRSADQGLGAKTTFRPQLPILSDNERNKHKQPGSQRTQRTRAWPDNKLGFHGTTFAKRQ